MIYLPFIVTTLYSLNNGVIKKPKKLCTAHTNVCPERRNDKIVEPLLMIKLSDWRQCRRMLTKYNPGS